MSKVKLQGDTPTADNLSDLYVENGKVRGKCSVCGDTKQYRQTRHPKYYKPYYFAVFEKNDWFRGNDTYRGKICKDCLKAGKISEANKMINNIIRTGGK